MQHPQTVGFIVGEMVQRPDRLFADSWISRVEVREENRQRIRIDDVDVVRSLLAQFFDR